MGCSLEVMEPRPEISLSCFELALERLLVEMREDPMKELREEELQVMEWPVVQLVVSGWIKKYGRKKKGKNGENFQPAFVFRVAGVCLGEKQKIEKNWGKKEKMPKKWGPTVWE